MNEQAKQNTKQQGSKNLKVFFSYFKPHMGTFIADMVCATLIAGLDLLFPVLTRYTVNNLLPEHNYRFFFIIILIMVGMNLLRSAASYFVTYIGHVFGTKVEADMRRDIFAHIEKQSFTFFDNNRTGQLMSRITNDLFEITELAHHGPEDLFISIITLIGSFIIMFSIRWELAVVVFAFVPAIILHTIRSRTRLNKNAKKVKERMAEINNGIESSISGVRVTKAFTNEDYEQERFSENNYAFYGSKRKYYKSMAQFHCLLDFYMQILSVAAIGIGGYLIMKSRLTLADLITANLFVASFLQPIKRLASFVEQFTTGMAGFNRFIEILNQHTETKENPNAVEIDSARGHIVYKDVSFSYNNDVMVLDDINLTIEPGNTVALVGMSGGGKTTLSNLLPRFYEIKSGTITLDGRDIKDITVQSLRKQIGIVQQDVFMFAGTIKDNIAYGCVGSSDEDIINAAKRAEIHNDIMKMPNGYDTIIGERGIKLSGGQKQRVSIARIFLKNPPILILDEATSALDTATEIKIQHAFDELCKGRTTIVIAHRLSTIKSANLIAVVDESGVAEQGTHTALLEKNGIYKKLYESQYSRN